MSTSFVYLICEFQATVMQGIRQGYISRKYMILFGIILPMKEAKKTTDQDLRLLDILKAILCTEDNIQYAPFHGELSLDLPG